MTLICLRGFGMYFLYSIGAFRPLWLFTGSLGIIASDAVINHPNSGLLSHTVRYVRVIVKTCG